MKFLKRLMSKLFKEKIKIYPYGLVLGKQMKKEFKNSNFKYFLWSSNLENYSIDESFYILNPRVGENIVVCKKEKGFFTSDSLVEVIPASKVFVAFVNGYFVNESGWLIPLSIPVEYRRKVSEDLNRVTYGSPPNRCDNSYFTKVSIAYEGQIVLKVSDGEKTLAVYTKPGDSLVFREDKPLSYDLWDTTPVMKIFRKSTSLSKN